MNASTEVAENPSPSTAISPSVLQVLSKAELDQAIETAHARPRSVTRFLQEARALATLNEAVAAEMIYALPRRERQPNGSYVTKSIEGPSARLAEIIISAWGNCRAGARVIEEAHDYVVCQGVFQDLEKNTAITYESRRSILTRAGDRFSPDMIATTANAACSIALRNAAFRGIPRALWINVYEGARRVVAGDAQTLESRRKAALELLEKSGVTRERILARLGVQGTQDIGLEHIVELRGLHNSLKDNELSVDEAFPPVGAPAPAEAPAKPKAETAQHFDAQTAREAIGHCNTVAQLDESWRAIVQSYKVTRRQLPVALEALKNERREMLREREGIQAEGG